MAPHANPIVDYYVNQAGSGVGHYFAGSNHQKGYGIGSFLGGLFRSIFPFVKSGARAVGREALRASSHVLADAASGENVKTSLKRHFSEAGDNLAVKMRRKAEEMNGSGIKRRRVLVSAHSLRKSPRVKTQRRKKTVPKTRDIFTR